MESATKAQEYQARIDRDMTIGATNSDNVMGNNNYDLSRMKVSPEFRRSNNPLDAVQNIRGYDAQGNKVLISQEAMPAGYVSGAGDNFASNYELISTKNMKKSVNRMFDRQFENQATFLKQNYNPHVMQMRPEDPRKENLDQSAAERESVESNRFLNNGNMNQMPQPQQRANVQCPQCNSPRNSTFLNDGGSVLICNDCHMTFPNPHFRATGRDMNVSAQGNWFSNQYAQQEVEKRAAQQARPQMRVMGATPNPYRKQPRASASPQQPHLPQQPKQPRQKQGIYGDGNYGNEVLGQGHGVKPNPYLDHANQQLMQYRHTKQFGQTPPLVTGSRGAMTR